MIGFISTCFCFESCCRVFASTSAMPLWKGFNPQKSWIGFGYFSQLLGRDFWFLFFLLFLFLNNHFVPSKSFWFWKRLGWRWCFGLKSFCWLLISRFEGLGIRGFGLFLGNWRVRFLGGTGVAFLQKFMAEKIRKRIPFSFDILNVEVKKRQNYLSSSKDLFWS